MITPLNGHDRQKMITKSEIRSESVKFKNKERLFVLKNPRSRATTLALIHPQPKQNLLFQRKTRSKSAQHHPCKSKKRNKPKSSSKASFKCLNKLLKGTPAKKLMLNTTYFRARPHSNHSISLNSTEIATYRRYSMKNQE